MTLSSICLITDDVPRLTDFYCALLDTAFDGDTIHAQVRTRGAGMAIYNAKAAREDMKLPVQTRGSRVTISFMVEDVDALYGRVEALSPRIINPPTTWPWGARSMQFTDPDGNIITFVTPGR